MSPSFLLGIEADVDGTSLKGSVLSIDGLNQHSSKLDGTVRGRVEFAQNKCLFAPGGFAWSEGSVTRTQIAALALVPPIPAPVGTVETASNPEPVGLPGSTGLRRQPDGPELRQVGSVLPGTRLGCFFCILDDRSAARRSPIGAA